MTVIRSQEDAPRGIRSGCGSPVIRTRSVTRPAAVRTCTRLTGGPMPALSAKATRITRAATGRVKAIWIHWPTAPVQSPDSHIVR